MHFKVAYVEVSPNFAGTIMGIVNGIANAMGIVVPMVVALMVDGNVSFILLEPYLCYMYCNNKYMYDSFPIFQFNFS